MQNGISNGFKGVEEVEFTLGEHGMRWIGAIWVVPDFVLGFIGDDEG